MTRNNTYNKAMAKAARRMALGCVLLFFGMGSALAQNDSPVVIKKGDHYLAHVKVGTEWKLKDVTAFHPDSCLWYTGPYYNHAGTNHNYYFIDHENKERFLSAPLEGGRDLSLSASLPETYVLSNTDLNYYFYDWDGDTYGKGIARGHQYPEIIVEGNCTHSWGQGECWDVF